MVGEKKRNERYPHEETNTASLRSGAFLRRPRERAPSGPRPGLHPALHPGVSLLRQGQPPVVHPELAALPLVERPTQGRPESGAPFPPTRYFLTSNSLVPAEVPSARISTL